MMIREQIEECLAQIRSFGEIEITVDYDDDNPEDRMPVVSDLDEGIYCNSLEDVLEHCQTTLADFRSMPDYQLAFGRSVGQDPRHFDWYDVD